MTEIGKVPDVGAPDPQQRHSPIFDSRDSDNLSLHLKWKRAPVSSTTRVTPSAFICSGNELLHCEEQGVRQQRGPVTSNKFPCRGVVYESSVTNYLA